jgi:hypothetical protein
MRLFLFFSFIILLPGCTSIEVAKEVNKVATSIKKSVTNIIKNKEKPIEKEDPKKLEKEIELELELELEKEIIKTEKKKEKKLVKQQKQIVKINFFSKTLDELRQDLGNPSLLRNDGGTQMARFDTLGCRLFFFFNSNLNLPRVEHFEIRDTKGNLIDKKEHIQNCYKNFKLT